MPETSPKARRGKSLFAHLFHHCPQPVHVVRNGGPVPTLFDLCAMAFHAVHARSGLDGGITHVDALLPGCHEPGEFSLTHRLRTHLRKTTSTSGQPVTDLWP